MARYVVALYLDSHSETRAVVRIRRDGDERAILYAQNWLHKSRLSTRYLGISFDRWSVALEREAGLTLEVATGVDELRVPTAAEQRARREAKAPKLKVTGSVTSRRAPRSSPRKLTPARPLSRLAQAVALAKQKVADNGIIPPLGSDKDG